MPDAAAAASPTVSSPTSVELTTAAPPTGRLAVLSAFAIAATAVPIPFLPDRVVSRVRGAVVHDVVSRHGRSITTDARDLLANPDSPQRTAISRVAETVARQLLKRVWPIAALTTAVRGFEVYALGHLFDRYMTNVRQAGTVRIHAEEARRLRELIDRSMLRAISPMLRPNDTTVAPGLEDLRDELTRWFDSALLTAAALPSYLERRLDAAFDEVAREMPGLRDG
jgi:hypothetical protein